MGIGRVQLVLKKRGGYAFVGFLDFMLFIWITGHPEMADKSAVCAINRHLRVISRHEF